MHNKTKIVVIHYKQMISAIIITVLFICFLIIACVALIGESKDESSNSKNAPTPTKSNTTFNKASNNDLNDTNSTYSAGVYTASINLNGEPVDIKVTLDSNHINSIEMVNLSESIKTMYPMLNQSFDEITNAVIDNNSTTNITYNTDNQYTAMVFLNGISSALNKAKN